MIFRQLFDSTSYTYTYLLSSKTGGEALIIDPVIDKVDHYLRLLNELDLKLVKAVDTHVHADHITALGALRDTTKCITVMGMKSSADVVSMRVEDGDTIDIEGISLKVLHTPGHTDDSCCFVMDDRVFTGDTLFIRGTGRTDFQNGDPAQLYHSIFDKLLSLPDETVIYPGHDYKGDTTSTIGEERAFNPRLQVNSVEDFVEILNNLNLANPKMIDVAVPANQSIGMEQKDPVGNTTTLPAHEAMQHLNDPSVLFIDLREESECQRDGIIPGSIHVPYMQLEQSITNDGKLHSLKSSGPIKQFLLYCSYGERSALALQTLNENGYTNALHIEGGINAWIENEYPLTHIQSS